MKCCAFFAKFFYFFPGLVFCWVDGEEGLEAKASARWRKRLVMVWSVVFVCLFVMVKAVIRQTGSGPACEPFIIVIGGCSSDFAILSEIV